MPEREHILVIGGGVGGALTHDLALRGFRVTLLERGELLSGATGRHHGLLHSGARYALHDPEAARECREENALLRRLAPQALEPNGGLFVAVDALDLSYRQAFLDGRAQGSGFMISDRLFMTNHHVIGSPADARGLSVEFDYALDGLRLNEGAAVLAQLGSAANEYVDHRAPWRLAKEGRTTELEETLAALHRALLRIAVLASPYLPGKAQELWHALGGSGVVAEWPWDQVVHPTSGGWKVSPRGSLFPKPGQATVTA